jgi:hypothetical protein
VLHVERNYNFDKVEPIGSGFRIINLQEVRCQGNLRFWVVSEYSRLRQNSPVNWPRGVNSDPI